MTEDSHINILDLPNEILCHILYNIKQIDTIRSIINTGNHRLIKLLFHGNKIKSLGESVDFEKTINIEFVKNFFDVSKIYPTIKIKSLEDIKTISLLPKVKTLKLLLPDVSGWGEFIDYINQFNFIYCRGKGILKNLLGITIECDNNRNLSKIFLCIKAKIITTNNYLTFYLFKNIFDFSMSDGSKILSTIPKEILFTFIESYRMYTPMKCFNCYNINRNINSINDSNEHIKEVAMMLSNIKELYVYHMSTRKISDIVILNKIKNKIRVIKSVYPKPIRERTLRLFEYNKHLRVFDIPVYVNLIKKILIKYPNLVNITLYHQNETLDELLNLSVIYPRLTKIKIYSKLNLQLPKPFIVEII